MERAGLIICRELSLGYEGQSVLNHLNLHIRAGDYLCVVGDNGAGKSTLLRGLLGLLPPLAGTIERAAERCLTILTRLMRYEKADPSESESIISEYIPRESCPGV